MKVLGVDIAGANIRWLIVHGYKGGGSLESVEPSTLHFPESGEEESENLATLQQLLVGHLQATKPDTVAVVKAGRDASPIRAKVECIVQLACRQLGIRCILVATQTVAAAEKRHIVRATGGKQFSEAFGTISPGYLARAASCAWTVLDG